MTLRASPADPFGRATRQGLKAAAQWIGVEVGGTILAAVLVIALSIPFESGKAYTIERAAVLVGTLLLGMLFRRKTVREELSWEALGYAPPTRRGIVAVMAGSVLLFLVVVGVTGPLDQFLFPEGAKRGADLLRMLREGGAIAAALLFVDNSFLTPIVEEYAWRGYIQTRLTQGLGLRNGLVVTVLLFAAKHVVADFSLIRLTTLLVGGFALGLIRIRWSTTASTITHLVVNTVATSFFIAEAFAGEPAGP